MVYLCCAYTAPDNSFFYHHTVTTAEASPDELPSGEPRPDDKNFLIIPSETHYRYEMLYLIEGDLEYIIEDGKYTLSPGDLILVDSYELHRLKIDLNNGPYERIVMQFSPELLPASLSYLINPFILDGNQNKRILSRQALKGSGTKEILLNIQKNCRSGDPFLFPMIVSDVIRLLAGLNRVVQTAKKAEKDPLPANPVIKSIIDYVRQNLDKKISTDTIAKALYLSSSYLSHTFKKYMGVSLNYYITLKKLQFAKYCMSQGMSAQEASAKAGWAYYSSFFYSYKKIMGHAPSKQKNNK